MAKEKIKHSIISNLVLTMISLIRWLFSIYRKISSNHKWDMTGILKQWEIKEISYFHMSKVNQITLNLVLSVLAQFSAELSSCEICVHSMTHREGMKCHWRRHNSVLVSKQSRFQTIQIKSSNLILTLKYEWWNWIK